MTAVGVVVGNPKPGSRTLTVAESVATAAAGSTGLDWSDRTVLDLCQLGPRLFDFGASDVREAVEKIASCRLVVIASPTYKASYTGLLKCFLDWYGTTGLARSVVVPVMVGAGLQHALAVEVHLRPVLVEIGATIPCRGLYVTEAQLEELDEVVAAWLVESRPRLQAALGVGART